MSVGLATEGASGSLGRRLLECRQSTARRACRSVGPSYSSLLLQNRTVSSSSIRTAQVAPGRRRPHRRLAPH